MENVIKTERLSLLPLSELDISFIQELSARPEFFRYDSDNAKPIDEVEKQCKWYIESTLALPDEGAIQWVVINDDTKIGEVHVTCNWEETLEWEIGWHFHSDYWGMGYATEATKAVIRYVFSNFNLNRLAAFISAANERSQALAQRIGMVQEGRLREVKRINGVYYDEYVYSILKREYPVV